MRGLPMFPPTQVVNPAARHISPASAVVVVFPAEPVIPTTGAGQRSRKSCASLLRGMPRCCAATTMGASSGTPPLRHTRSAPSNRLSG